MTTAINVCRSVQIIADREIPKSGLVLDERITYCADKLITCSVACVTSDSVVVETCWSANAPYYFALLCKRCALHAMYIVEAMLGTRTIDGMAKMKRCSS